MLSDPCLIWTSAKSTLHMNLMSKTATQLEHTKFHDKFPLHWAKIRVWVTTDWSISKAAAPIYFTPTYRTPPLAKVFPRIHFLVLSSQKDIKAAIVPQSDYFRSAFQSKICVRDAASGERISRLYSCEWGQVGKYTFAFMERSNPLAAISAAISLGRARKYSIGARPRSTGAHST